MLFWSQQGACSNSEAAYRQKSILVRRGPLACAVLVCVTPGVHAQDATPGILATLDVTQRLEWSDNPDLDVDGDSDFYGRTILGFGLESATSIQNFALNLGTDIEEFRDTNDQNFDFDNSFARLDYSRATRNASAGANLRYRQSDVDGDFTFTDQDFDQDSNIITQTDGTRKVFGYALRGAVGEEAPLGASFDWDYNEINFEDTDDFDNTLDQFSGQVDFRVDPRVTLSLTGRYLDFDTEDPDGTDRKEKDIGLASEFAVTPILTLDARLSYTDIERRGGTNQDDDGISGEIGVTREMPNGTLGLRYASEVFANTDGRRSFLAVSRNMDLPLGALDVSVGVTGADAVGSDPLIEANYRYDLPAAQLTFGLRQRVVVDDEDNEDINTSLRAAYDQEINLVSSFGVSLNFFDRNALDNDEDDAQRIEIGLNYRHDLTEDWGVVSGISYTALDEEDSDDRDRTTIFVGLQRSFSLLR